MIFSSIPFLYYFLPLVLIIYFLVPSGSKNLVLLGASLIFYGWGEPKYVILMAASIVIGYVLGIQIEKFRGTAKGKGLTALSVAVSLGFLLYFKYADFFISSFNDAFKTDLPLFNVVLPIGISFYTFQLLSYTIDVSTGKVNAQRNLITLGTYIAMFPQLIAGPIVRYTQIENQLVSRQHTMSGAAKGIRRFIIGLGKKVIIANTLGQFCSVFQESNEISTVYAWVYAAAFGLQVYYDFSGYSDMAIGLGNILGFDFAENFNYPFISKSVTEFWRRWHMTLGGWFRDYLYIPLGGNRVSKGRWIINTLIVWMATGLWHGAAYNYVIWGLYFAAVLMIEKHLLLKLLEKHPAAAHLYTTFAVLISFVIFNGTSMAAVGGELSAMFGIGEVALINEETVFFIKSYGITLIIAAVGATPAVKNIFIKMGESEKGMKALTILEPVFLASVLIIVTASLVNGSFNPFLYFRF